MPLHLSYAGDSLTAAALAGKSDALDMRVYRASNDPNRLFIGKDDGSTFEINHFNKSLGVVQLNDEDAILKIGNISPVEKLNVDGNISFGTSRNNGLRWYGGYQKSMMRVESNSALGNSVSEIGFDGAVGQAMIFDVDAAGVSIFKRIQYLFGGQQVYLMTNAGNSIYGADSNSPYKMDIDGRIRQRRTDNYANSLKFAVYGETTNDVLGFRTFNPDTINAITLGGESKAFYLNYDNATNKAQLNHARNAQYGISGGNTIDGRAYGLGGGDNSLGGYNNAITVSDYLDITGTGFYYVLPGAANQPPENGGKHLIVNSNQHNINDKFTGYLAQSLNGDLYFSSKNNNIFTGWRKAANVSELSTVIDRNNWNDAYNWGNHSAEGYVKNGVNAGNGVTIFKGKVNDNLKFARLFAGADIDINAVGDTVEIVNTLDALQSFSLSANSDGQYEYNFTESGGNFTFNAFAKDIHYNFNTGAPTYNPFNVNGSTGARWSVGSDGKMYFHNGSAWAEKEFGELSISSENKINTATRSHSFGQWTQAHNATYKLDATRIELRHTASSQFINLASQNYASQFTLQNSQLTLGSNGSTISITQLGIGLNIVNSTPVTGQDVYVKSVSGSTAILGFRAAANTNEFQIVNLVAFNRNEFITGGNSRGLFRIPSHLNGAAITQIVYSVADGTQGTVNVQLKKNSGNQLSRTLSNTNRYEEINTFISVSTGDLISISYSTSNVGVSDELRGLSMTLRFTK